MFRVPESVQRHEDGVADGWERDLSAANCAFQVAVFESGIVAVAVIGFVLQDVREEGTGSPMSPQVGANIKANSRNLAARLVMRPSRPAAIALPGGAPDHHSGRSS